MAQLAEDKEKEFCGTPQLEAISKKLEEMLKSGMSKDEILSEMPQEVQEAMRLFSKL